MTSTRKTCLDKLKNLCSKTPEVPEINGEESDRPAIQLTVIKSSKLPDWLKCCWQQGNRERLMTDPDNSSNRDRELHVRKSVIL
ncbi:MAG TPA: hypothetical protein VLI69_01345 [Gammaproteobacteria bacterium]|nr:hypothetical protein [Gammaproteobacteria bacterium]